MAKITFISKKGYRDLPGNYRPISVLQQLAKCLNGFFYTMKFLITHQKTTYTYILSENQLVSRKNYSNATALLSSTKDWFINKIWIKNSLTL